MKVNLSGPDVTQAEIDAVVAVMRTPNLSLGPKLGEFETAFADYIGRKYAVAVNSGTSGLHLCMLAYGIGPGDEVITTPFSFISTTNCVLMVGAEPVFVDIDPETYNIDVEAIEAKIGPKTKAILPVEVFGNPAGMDKVYELARKHNLVCVEDSCEGLGSSVNGKKVGTLGHVSTFAFYPNKQMTTGEGGIILTDDEEVALMCGSLRNQGRDLNAGWLAHARLGYNYRLSDINCALGIVQLSRIDEIIRKRREVFEIYKEVLADEKRVVCPADPEGCEVNWFVYVVRLTNEFGQEQRDKVLEILRGEGIGCSNYFSPIHLQPFVAEQLGCGAGDFPETEKVAGRTIALPFYNDLGRADVEMVSVALRKALDEVS